MDGFIHIRSDKFPALEGEEQELVNEGMYGRALSQYLCVKLTEHGYQCSDPFCEDWGWAVLVSCNGVSTMICIYSDPTQESPTDFACTADGPKRKWSWRRFRYVNTEPHEEWYSRFRDRLFSVFRDDSEVEVLSVTKEFPLG